MFYSSNSSSESGEDGEEPLLLALENDAPQDLSITEEELREALNKQ